ncbi:MAG: hypothetical protein HEP71_10265 [Roseivirga sp.]|nr:hypothetical protein [Roseivirga sp.]
MIYRHLALLTILAAFLLNSISMQAQSHILFSRGAGQLNTGETPDLMMYDVAKGTTQLIMKGSVRRRGEGNPAVSPDNKQIVFNTYRFSGWKLAIADYKEGKITNIRRFTNRPNYEYNASWSHDGKWITYQEYNWGTDKGEIFIRNQTTGKITKLNKSKAPGRTPSWTADDQKIVFNHQTGTNNDIYIADRNGSTIINISNHPAHDFAPSCSPKEQKLAFLSNKTGRLHLYTMDEDGKNRTDLTPDLASDTFVYDNWQNSASWGYKTSWSPDGKQIVFNALIDGDIELFIVNADGTGLKQITDNNDADIAPHWAPKG